MISWGVCILAFLIGVVQTPLLVDLLRVILPGWNIKRFTNKTVGILLITLVTFLSMAGLGLQVFYFIPLFPTVPFRNLKLFCHSVFAYWVWVNMIVNYYRAVLTNAGSTTMPISKDNESLTKAQEQNHNRDDSSEQDENFINKSSVLKEKQLTYKSPAEYEDKALDAQQINIVNKRYNFCKECQVITLYMDHHCPFTANCVGLNTFSYFFLYLYYATIGVGYSLLVSLFYFGECVFPGAWNWLQLEPLDRHTIESLQPFTDLLLPALGVFVALYVLLGFQVFLLLSDLTTFEFLNNLAKYPMLRIGYERIRNKEYSKEDSRLNVLLLSKRRNNMLWLLIPVRNM